MCCACGGGNGGDTSSGTDEYTTGSTDNEVCHDTSNGAFDSVDHECDAYASVTNLCGIFDDDDFTSIEMCCVCGGGSSSNSG